MVSLQLNVCGDECDLFLLRRDSENCLKVLGPENSPLKGYHANSNVFYKLVLHYKKWKCL